MSLAAPTVSIQFWGVTQAKSLLGFLQNWENFSLLFIVLIGHEMYLSDKSNNWTFFNCAKLIRKIDLLGLKILKVGILFAAGKQNKFWNLI